MKGFENDFDDSNRFFVKSAGTTPKRTTTPKMKRKKMRRRSGRSDDDDDEVFFFFFFVDAGEEGDARLLRPPNPSSSIFLLSSSIINKQRGEGGKKNEEDAKNRRKKNRSRRSSISFVFFCSSVLPCLCLLILRFKNISVSKEGKKVPLTEKVTFLLFYIAPHKTRAQNAKHSPLSRSKIHIFDSYILQVKRSTRAAINGSFAHHPQTNKRIVIWKGKKIPSSIFFYKKRP